MESASPTTERWAVRDMLLRELAKVQDVDERELREELDRVGDNALEVDSKPAEVVLARLEHYLDQKIAGVDQLEPEQVCTVGALLELIAQSWED